MAEVVDPVAEVAVEEDAVSETKKRARKKQEDVAEEEDSVKLNDLI